MDELTPTPVTVDAHVHVVSPDTARYPLTGGTRDGADYWSDGSSSADAVLAALSASGVGRAVLVQGVGAYGFDCRYTLDAAARHAPGAVAVAAVDPGDPRAAARRVAGYAGDPRVTGVRLFAVRGGPSAPDPAWLADPAADAVWDAVEQAGLTAVLTVFMRQLGRVRPRIEARPGLRVAIDHCAFPDPGSRAAGRAAVRALADLPGVHLKVTTHLLSAARAAGEDPADVVDDLAVAFGDRRLAWGSDHPQTRTPPYGAKVALAREAVRRRDPAGRAWILGGTASRLWFRGT